MYYRFRLVGTAITLETKPVLSNHSVVLSRIGIIFYINAFMIDTNKTIQILKEIIEKVKIIKTKDLDTNVKS